MEPRRLHLDWRGKPDLSKPAEFYSVAATHETRPVTGNPKGRVLVGVSATLMYGPSGVVTRPYNYDLFTLASGRGALTGRVVWDGGVGWRTELVDMTKRGMIQGWLALIDKHFPWADGIHLDYASAWSWQFPDLEPTDAAWNAALSGFCTGILGRKKLALCQQFQPTEITQAASGAFWEQYPECFGYSLIKHASDVAMFRAMVARVDNRETLFVSELREAMKFPIWYRDELKAWALKNDVVLSWGRDASAGAGLA